MLKLASGFLFSLILLSTAAAQSQPGWITSTQGCKIWDSTPQPNETVSWSGPCKAGYAHGKGTLIWYLAGRPHETYEGELRRGHYDGYGLQIWPDGARYEGRYRKDRAHGKGTYRGANGDVYSGKWVNGCYREGNRRWSIGAAPSECH